MSFSYSAAPGNPSQKLLVRFSAFLRHHKPGSVSRHLRIIILEYIRQQLDDGLPLDFDEWLTEFNALFAVLDLAAEEYN